MQMAQPLGPDDQEGPVDNRGGADHRGRADALGQQVGRDLEAPAWPVRALGCYAQVLLACALDTAVAHCHCLCLVNRTDNAIKNHWYSSMRRTMRRMAKQQNKSLGQTGRSVLSGKPTKLQQQQQQHHHHQQFLQHHQQHPHHHHQLSSHTSGSDLARGFVTDLESPSTGMRHGLSPKQVYKDCYSAMLKSSENINHLHHHHHDDDGSFSRLLGNHLSNGRNGASSSKSGGGALLLSGGCMSMAPKKANNAAKRKRKDLRICTGAVESGSMYLPDTPRRVLHTQLLLQLLGTNSTNPAGDDVQGNSAKRKKRSATPVHSKNGLLTHAIAMQPSKASEYSGEQCGMDDQAFNDMDGSFHSFEHLDIDFNEVRDGVMSAVLPGYDSVHRHSHQCSDCRLLSLHV